MFFLRSIRRRLVTGFTVALSLLLLLAGSGIMGLIWHQQAVSELEETLHHSPDKAALCIAFSGMQAPFYAKLDLSQEAAVREFEAEFRAAVAVAAQEARTFRERIELLNVAPDRRQRQVLAAIDRDVPELVQVASTVQLNATTGAARQQAIIDLRELVAERVVHLQELLSGFAVNEESRFSSSLQRELRRSSRLLRFVVAVTIAAIALYSITVFFGFRWISNPLRAVATGASRIANGDTEFRIARVSCWNDEFADLTENVNRMADRFQQAEEDLQKKVEERSRQLIRSERLAGVGFLAAGVAHEINNPLSAISMAAESIQYRIADHLDPQSPDAVEIPDRLAMIRRESKRCGEITARILDFSRDNPARMVIDDLTRIVGEVLAIIRPMGRYQDRKIVFNHVAPVMAEVNASQIKQVILNLTANALQATHAGGVVQIFLREQIDWVVIEIQDDGEGMSPETIHHLFEPFYSTKETGQGTGLGLSITHRIVEDHGGTIDPVSQGPGQGSIFRVRLPKLRSRPHAA